MPEELQFYMRHAEPRNGRGGVWSWGAMGKCRGKCVLYETGFFIGMMMRSGMRFEWQNSIIGNVLQLHSALGLFPVPIKKIIFLSSFLFFSCFVTDFIFCFEYKIFLF